MVKKLKKNTLSSPKIVDSLLNNMKDGREYESIISLTPKNGEIITDLKLAIKNIQEIRGKPAICYFGNIIRPSENSSINLTDDLPFNELIESIPKNEKEIDIVITTSGGAGQQVSQFVNSLRKRFDRVDFILPSICMSAGTLLVCSGDDIWMDERAIIGPIDPQVPASDGRFVPAQSILVLLNKIKEEGESDIKSGKKLSWHLIRLIDTMDRRQIGAAITASEYSIKLASDFLRKFKFKHWKIHETENPGTDVTDEDRRKRAEWVATKLCEHEYWKSHAHGIDQHSANEELRLKIKNLSENKKLNNAVRKLWALVYYSFERSQTAKMFLSEEYTFFRVSNTQK